MARQAHEQREIVILRMEQIEMNMIRELSAVKKEVTELRARVAKLEQETGD